MKSTTVSVVALATTLVAIYAINLATGPKGLQPDLIGRWLQHSTSAIDEIILSAVRMPRAALGMLVGATLGSAGYIAQNAARNPLASPELLGATSGAAFAVVLFIFIAQGSPSLLALSIAAGLGALSAGLAGFTLAGGWSMSGLKPLRLILAGAILSMMLGALTSALITISSNTLEISILWLAGSLADRPPELSYSAVFPALAVLGLALGLSSQIRLLALSDDVAACLGVNIHRWRLIALFLATTLTAIAVTLAGPIGFIGLAAPHIAQFVTCFNRAPMLVCMVTGASLTLAADTLARIIAMPAEIPVAVVTALLGAPIMVLVLRRMRVPE